MVSSCVSNVAERDASSKHTIRLDEMENPWFPRFECGRKGREQQTHNPIGRKTTLFFGLACALLEATVNVHTYCYFKHVQPMSQAQAGAVVSLIF